MINHKNNTDDFLKDFLQKADIESPSADFTKIVMHKVNAVAVQPSFYQQLLQKIKGWYLLALAGTGAVIYAIRYLLQSDSKLLSEDFNPLILPVFKKMFLSFSGLFQSMQVSSFTIVIIAAIVGLVLIDRLISKIKAGRQIYLSL